MKIKEILDSVLTEQREMFADKFYTNPTVAKSCIDKLGDLSKYDRIIEPSAGNGAFSKQIPGVEAYDLYPEDKSIKKQDFLKFHAEKGNILVIGNPPFGKSSKLAIAFVNHAASFAKTIAMILPSTFARWSVQKQLLPNIELVRFWPLPRNAFLVEGKPYEVQCMFFLFKVTNRKTRKVPTQYETKDFKFVKKGEEDFCLLKKGWNVGRVLADDSKIADSSRFYIKSNINVKKLKSRLSTLSYPESKYVLGSDSLTKNEVVGAYYRKYETPIKEELIDYSILEEFADENF